ncbi:hypothetical protein E8E12_010118 [Didymella heteroderae]|uniref:Transmembrane protein n=1 Tax=Didymella heteroderae TaxID=1769908 RepID=A0A9P4WYI8_9PLEO|nr:hypothetical protein E8E12_010118 [Didymella heteroderae]
MVVAIRTCLNIRMRLLQTALAATILAASLTLQHVKDNDETVLIHLPTLLFVSVYGRVVDLLGIMFNLAAGSTKEGCPTQDKSEKSYNGPEHPECREEGKLDWLLGNKCANMGLRFRVSRIASVLCFIVVALLLVTLAFGSFIERKPGPPEVVQKKRLDGDFEIDIGTAVTYAH